MTTIHLPDITGPMDEAIEVLRVCAEKSVFTDEDLLARLIKARSQAERAGIALHLAEQFVRIAEPARIATCARLNHFVMPSRPHRACSGSSRARAASR